MSLHPRQSTVVLALVGVAVVAAGATATAALTSGTTTTAASPVVTTTAPMRMPMDSAPPTTAPTTATATAVPTAVPRTASTTGPVSMAQAVALAARRTHARPDHLEVKAGPAGVDYEVKLVRPDGSDVKVLVVGRTGQVLSEYQLKLLDDRVP